MIDFLRGNIILAQSDKIIYYNIETVLKESRGANVNFVSKEITEGL